MQRQKSVHPWSWTEDVCNIQGILTKEVAETLILAADNDHNVD